MIKVCAVEEIAPGTAIRSDVDGVEVAVVRTGDGQVFAVHDVCSHQEVPLSEGEIDGCTVECWLHGSRFDLRTGEPTGPPATQPVPTFPVEIRDGFVFVSLTPSNGVSL
ncbi:MAG: non-heme iron oxygenase ferredoxin subunit [Micromonosporaceae bacterium]|nr:non-heme iron oxygenase ferredoxin subunit [Micromonosporaceae bacterium]